ncbi:MAG: Crp/Fnr family transcriptional regulator [Lyngbya sp.]|nr:Crp/Fnr family transcriptional regulator [Lyngbya sp.]
MAKAKQSEPSLAERLIAQNYLFRELDADWLANYLPRDLAMDKLYSNRPVYTAFRPNTSGDVLYLILEGGFVITRSTPLNRVISITYPGGCFGMRNLPFSYGRVGRAFPSLVEAYKTTDVIKLPLETLQALYNDSEQVRDRYEQLFELREKFIYHLLNCSSYPPQAVATLLRALIYQERALGNQPNSQGVYNFDLPIDIISHACQLNHRTVEQVLKGMQKVKLIELPKSSDESGDMIHVLDAEGLKEVYGATRDKVSWWPLR